MKRRVRRNRCGSDSALLEPLPTPIVSFSSGDNIMPVSNGSIIGDYAPILTRDGQQRYSEEVNQ